jgi:hypothetical protein
MSTAGEFQRAPSQQRLLARRRAAEPSPVAISGVLEVESPGDSGVTDFYTLSVRGAPFEAIPDEQAGYRIRGVPIVWGTDSDPLIAEVTQERIYWLSRSRKQRLT